MGYYFDWFYKSDSSNCESFQNRTDIVFFVLWVLTMAHGITRFVENEQNLTTLLHQGF